MKSVLLTTSFCLGLGFSAYAQDAKTPPLSPTPAPAQSENIMIILDSSGSMWGQIDGKTKRDIARNALKDMADGFSPSAHVGLMAYGHRRKGDCNDIEVLFAPKENGAVDMVKRAKNLRSKGKTPLSAAVRKAAEVMKYTEDKSTVILITDGLETCNLDPCALGKDLEKAGIDFTTHIVGFGSLPNFLGIIGTIGSVCPNR